MNHWTDKDEQDFTDMLARRDAYLQTLQRPVDVLVAQMFPMASYETRQRLVNQLITRAEDVRRALKPFDASKT